MAIDDATLEKLKKLDDKEKIKKLLEKRLPDIDPERFKDLERFKDKKKKLPDDFLERFKEQFKDKKKRDDKKDTPIIPKDFFKGKRFDPNDPRMLPYKLPERFNPDNKRKFYENMPYKIRPSDKMPGIQLLKKGGTVKGYKAGGEVKTDKSPNSGMITKRGWGKSRKT